MRLGPHVTWTPVNGDMFFIPRPEIGDSVFIISDMVVELVTSGGESRFHFNGTVEWALDSVESDGVVWLPREDQLREMLGGGADLVMSDMAANTTGHRKTDQLRIVGLV